MPFGWTCPFCNRNATIVDENRSFVAHQFNNGNKHGYQRFASTVIVCPNPQCGEYTLKAELFDNFEGASKEPKESWQLVPAAEMKVFPDYVPAAVLADYKEACLIRHLSPKASATLSRRCLQGMIRDFWGVKQGRLIDEIEAIQEKVDPTTWSAIDAVRRIGNIGAHMERDINLIIEVDAEEAALLIGLIEMLINDWYVIKHEREQRMAMIIAAAGAKEQAKSGGK
jgi:hypothetical protein